MESKKPTGIRGGETSEILIVCTILATLEEFPMANYDQLSILYG